MRLQIHLALCVTLTFVGLPTLPAEEDLLAPQALTVAQADYGPLGTLLLTWTSPQLYEGVEIQVDGQIVEGEADAVAGTAFVEAEVGRRVVEVRGTEGDLRSAWTRAEFTVLGESPVRRPITNLACDYMPDMGGRLHLTWQLGDDPWVSGRLEVPTWEISMTITAGTTEATIESGTDVPHLAYLTFVNADGYYSPPYTPLCVVRGPGLRRGDCDGSGRVNMTDVIFTLNHLFRGGPRWFCDDACDANDDGELNISDPIATLGYLFQGTGPLPAPGAVTCGADLTDDLLGGLCRCK